MQSFRTLGALILALCVTLNAHAQPLDLKEALSRAATHNPSLKAAYAQLALAKARVTQAKVFENPELEAKVLWSSHHPSPLQEYALTYNIGSLFSHSGKVSAARSRYQGALAQTLLTAIDLEADIKKAFYTVQGHAQGLDEEKILLRLAELQADLAQRQRDAGNISQLVLAGYQATMMEVRLRVYDRELALFQARQELARLMGQVEEADTLTVTPQLPDLPNLDAKAAPELIAEALDSRQDLLAQQQELHALQTERGLQNRLIFDGTHLGYAYERETNLDTLQGVALSMPLPIFDRRQGQKARLDAEVSHHHAQQETLSQEIVTEVKVRLIQMANARLKVSELEKLSPLRETILDLTQRQVNAMLKGTYDLLSARSDIALTSAILADAKADYWRASVDLERALGRSILKNTLSLPQAPEAK